MTTATKLDIEGFSGLVQELAEKRAFYGVEFSQAVELLKEIAALIEQLPGTSELNREKIVNQLQERRAQLPVGLTRIYRAHGYSFEEAERLLGDPQNFTQPEWEAIQEVRREVEARTLQSSPSTFGWLAVNKKNNK